MASTTEAPLVAEPAKEEIGVTVQARSFSTRAKILLASGIFFPVVGLILMVLARSTCKNQHSVCPCLPWFICVPLALLLFPFGLVIMITGGCCRAKCNGCLPGPDEINNSFIIKIGTGIMVSSVFWFLTYCPVFAG